MTSPTQKKQQNIENRFQGMTITRCTFDVESHGQARGHQRKHLRLDFEDGGTVLITGQFHVLYNFPDIADAPGNGDDGDA